VQKQVSLRPEMKRFGAARSSKGRAGGAMGTQKVGDMGAFEGEVEGNGVEKCEGRPSGMEGSV